MLNNLITNGFINNHIRGIGIASLVDPISEGIQHYLNNANVELEVYGSAGNGIALGHFEGLNDNDFMYCMETKVFDRSLRIWDIFKGIGEGLNKYLVDYRIEKPILYSNGMGLGHIKSETNFKLSEDISEVLSKGFVKYMESRQLIFEVYG